MERQQRFRLLMREVGALAGLEISADDALTDDAPDGDALFRFALAAGEMLEVRLEAETGAVRCRAVIGPLPELSSPLLPVLLLKANALAEAGGPVFAVDPETAEVLLTRFAALDGLEAAALASMMAETAERAAGWARFMAEYRVPPGDPRPAPAPHGAIRG